MNDLSFKACYRSWPLSKEENAKYYEEHGINEMLAEIKKESAETYNSSKNK